MRSGSWILLGKACAFAGSLMACAVPASAQIVMPPTGAVEAANEAGRSPAIDCMTSAIVHEAGFEPVAGQEAVAEVILNRLHNPAYPKTVCGVIFQGSERRTGCQFSFTCDGALRRASAAEMVARAREVATRAVDGLLTPRTSGATHYHANYVSPYWAPSLLRVAAIGRHIFYRPLGASSLSILTRYASLGDKLPAILARGVMTAAPDSARGPAEPASAPERFMPWGLSAGGLGQSATSSKR